MPLVKYLGNATAEDNTEIIHLADDEEGNPRELVRGGDPLEVTGEELQTMAGNYQVEVVEDPSSAAPAPSAPTPGAGASPSGSGISSSTPPVSPGASG